MKNLRRAAHEALMRRYAGSTSASLAVEAVTVSVADHAGSELVSLRLREEGLSVTCTCGEDGCAHVHAALVLLESAPAAAPTEERITQVWEAPARVAEPARVAAEQAALNPRPTAAEPRVELADTLADAITAVVRSGVSAGVSAGASEALEQLARMAPAGSATELRVWIGALKVALSASDVPGTLRLLAAAEQIVDALRAQSRTEENEARITTWLGPSTVAGGTEERVSERTWIELAREWRPGVERAGIERRYVIDLADGQLFREDRAGSERIASLGPCPRVINVGLASLEPGTAPRRARLLQYTTTPTIDEASWEQVGLWAVRSFERLLEHYTRFMRSFASEPVVLVAPKHLEDGARPLLVDDHQRRLVLTGPEGVARQLASTLERAEPMWLLGRLGCEGNLLALTPLALCARRHGRVVHEQC